ncbi:MAG: dynamin family protein [Hyphomicrobiales bacterium]
MVTWRRIAPRASILSIAERIRHLLKGLGFVPSERLAVKREGAARIHDQFEAAMDQSREDGDVLQPTAATDRMVKDLQQEGADPFCLGLFGEFSAGKSSLANLLICTDLLPTSVLSSTRVPTKLVHADELSILAHMVDGDRQQLTVAAAKELDQEEVEIMEIGLPNDLLRYVELLDTPGFSDPYHASDRTLAAVDRVHIGLWCTLATQAWRYSEQILWTSLPEHLRTAWILVVTHGDSLPTERDRRRVMTRLQREAGEFFQKIVMISVPDAIRSRASDGSIVDTALWRASGGEALLRALLDSLNLAMAQRGQAGVEGDSFAPELLERRDRSGAEVKAPEADDAGLAAEDDDIRSAEGYPKDLMEEEATQGELSEASPSRRDGHSSEEPDPFDDVIDGLLQRALETIQACRAAAFVDLAAGRLLRLRTAGDEPLAQAERVVGFASDLFQGPTIRAIEQKFEALRGGTRKGHHYIQEIVISGDDALCLLMRSRREPTKACLIFVDSGANMGLAMAKARMIMAEINRRT